MLTKKLKIIIGGDLKQLHGTVVESSALTPLVHQPTRDKSFLDRLYVSKPCYETIKILKSSINSDHKAIVAVAYLSITRITWPESPFEKGLLSNTLSCYSSCQSQISATSLLFSFLNQLGLDNNFFH